QVLEHRGQLPVGDDCFRNLQKSPELLGGGTCLSFLYRFMHFKILRGITHSVFRSWLTHSTHMISRRISVQTCVEARVCAGNIISACRATKFSYVRLPSTS